MGLQDSTNLEQVGMNMEQVLADQVPRPLASLRPKRGKLTQPSHYSTAKTLKKFPGALWGVPMWWSLQAYTCP